MICRVQFGKLGQMIEAHPRLKEQSRFLFIPGPDDAGIYIRVLVHDNCLFPKRVALLEILTFHNFRSINGSSPVCFTKISNWRAPEACSKCRIFYKSLQVICLTSDCLIYDNVGLIVVESFLWVHARLGGIRNHVLWFQKPITNGSIRGCFLRSSFCTLG